MTENTAPAGWYPDGSGETRWWDGTQWTEHFQSKLSGSPAVEEAADLPAAVEPVEDQAPVTTYEPAVEAAASEPVIPTSTTATKPVNPWYLKRWLIGVVAGVVGIALGATAAGSSNPKDSSEYKSVAAKLESMTADRDTLRNGQAPLEAAVAKVDDRQKALDDRESSLKARESQVKSDAAAVKKREKRVGIVETTIKNNTIDGDGIYQVGKDIKAGTYRTKGGAQCYYAVLRDTKGGLDSIVTNNNITGSGIVTVGAGQFLELQGCNAWVRQ